MTWACAYWAKLYAEVPAKSALQRVIFGPHVLEMLEAKKIGFRTFAMNTPDEKYPTVNSCLM